MEESILSSANVFTSIDMINEIQKISETHRTIFSIFNHLPLDMKKRICECCLCRAIRWKQFCILKDPLSRNCFKNEIDFDTNQRSSNELCVNCVRVVSLIASRKNRRTKWFGCVFPSCEFKSQYSSYLKRHYLIHLNVNNWKCSMCEQNFRRKSRLLEHQRKCLWKR